MIVIFVILWVLLRGSKVTRWISRIMNWPNDWAVTLIVNSTMYLNGRWPSYLNRAHIHHISHVITMVVSDRLVIVALNTNWIMSTIDVFPSTYAVVGAVWEVAYEYGLSWTPWGALYRFRVDLRRCEKEGCLKPVHLAVLEIHKAHHLIWISLMAVVLGGSLNTRLPRRLNHWWGALVFQKLKQIVLIYSHEAYGVLWGVWITYLNLLRTMKLSHRILLL